MNEESRRQQRDAEYARLRAWLASAPELPEGCQYLVVVVGTEPPSGYGSYSGTWVLRAPDEVCDLRTAYHVLGTGKEILADHIADEEEEGGA